MDDASLAILFGAIFLIVLYFIPTIIAFSRGSPYAWVIFVLNLMGGWTGIAWFAAFIWALWPKGHSAAAIDINMNHSGAVDLYPNGYPAMQPPYGQPQMGQAFPAQAHPSQAHMAYAPQPALPQHANNNMDQLERLERLAHLRTIGAITLEEFEQQKAALLNS